MATQDEVARRIFDALPENLLGDELVVDASGQPAEDDDEPAGEPTVSEPDDDTEALEALHEEEADEGEEVEEPEVADEDEEDEEEDVEGTDDTLYTVRESGEEYEVTLDELLDGYSRTASYTRKSQKLAEDRRQFEAEQESVRAERADYGAKLLALEEQLTRLVPQEPESDDPREWIRYQRATQELEKVQAERQKVLEAAQADVKRQKEQITEREIAALKEAVPAWRDSTVMSNELDQLFRYAVGTLGFEEDDVRAVLDHRVILMLRENFEARKILGQKAEVVKKTKKAKTLKPGARPSQKSVARAKKKKVVRQGREALRKSGRVDDAASAILDAGIFDDL